MKSHIISALFIAGALILGGCQSVNGSLSISPSVQTSIQNIGSFTLADLQNADANAVANSDVIGDTCYKGLITFVQQEQAQIGAQTGQTVNGAFSAFEQARIAGKAVVTGLSPQQVQSLELSCAPLVIDQQKDATTFLANIAALGKL